MDSSSSTPTELGMGNMGPLRARGPRRSTAACQRCRKRKQKCDGQHPACGQCLSSGVPCEPSRRIVLQGSRCRECEILRDEVHTLRQKVTALKPQQGDPCVEYSCRNRGDGGGQPDVDLSARHSRNPSPQPARQAGYEKQNHVNAHPINGIRFLRPTFRRPNRSGVVDLSCPWHLWDGLLGDSPGQTDCPGSRPSMHNAAELVDQFFIRRWPQYPILHRPTFMTAHYLPFSREQGASDLSSFLVYMVLAIGAHERLLPTSTEAPQHFQFFQAAVRHLPAVLDLDDEDVVLCLLLLCIYGVNEPQLVDLWYTIGVAIRLALGADLHRSDSAAAADLLETEMRKRLFWSLYAMDRTVAIALGRPLGINEADITVPVPMNMPDEAGMDPGTATASNNLSAFLHILGLRRLKSEIYTTMHLPSGNDRTEVVSLDLVRSNFQTRLDKWLADCPRNPTPSSMHQTREWQQVAYHQAMLMLYRPSHASPSPGTDAALHRCLDSSISLIGCYAALYSRNKVTYTFVTLVSLFMAAITMLHALRADPNLRDELSCEVVDFNLRTCASLLRRVSGSQVGERSADIVERLGAATLGVFDGRRPESTKLAEDSNVGAEFTTWFGVQKLNQSSNVNDQFSSSIDMILSGILGQEFDLGDDPQCAFFGETWP